MRRYQPTKEQLQALIDLSNLSLEDGIFTQEENFDGDDITAEEQKKIVKDIKRIYELAEEIVKIQKSFIFG